MDLTSNVDNLPRFCFRNIDLVTTYQGGTGLLSLPHDLEHEILYVTHSLDSNTEYVHAQNTSFGTRSIFLTFDGDITAPCKREKW